MPAEGYPLQFRSLEILVQMRFVPRFRVPEGQRLRVLLHRPQDILVEPLFSIVQHEHIICLQIFNFPNFLQQPQFLVYYRRLESPFSFIFEHDLIFVVKAQNPKI